MIEAINKNGQKVIIEGVWVAKYSNNNVVLSADLGDKLHTFNNLKLIDDTLHIEDVNHVGRYDADYYEGLVVKSCDLEEGYCTIERIALDENNYKAVLTALSR